MMESQRDYRMGGVWEGVSPMRLARAAAITAETADRR